MRIDDPMLFDWTDFFEADEVQLMSSDQVAAYIRLLAAQWRDGDLAADARLLAARASSGVRVFTVEDFVGSHPEATLEAPLEGCLWEGLKPCFEMEGGIVRNRRVAAEREAWTSKKKRWSEGGKAGGIASGKARKSKKKKDLERSAKPGLSHPSSLGQRKSNDSRTKRSSLSLSPSKKKKDKAPTEPPAASGGPPPLNEQALRIQRIEERFKASGVRPPKPSLIGRWLKTLGSEERMMAFLDDMDDRGKLSVVEYCGKVIGDWQPRKSGRTLDNRSREERRLAEMNESIMNPVPAAPPIDVEVRLEALASKIPEALSRHAKAIRELSGDVADIEVGLQRIDEELTRELPRILGEEKLAGLREEKGRRVRRLATRTSWEQVEKMVAEVWKELLRSAAGVPELSLFSPEATQEGPDFPDASNEEGKNP